MKVELGVLAPGEILERLYPNGQLGGITMDGAPPARLGESVDLVLRVKARKPGHFTVHTRVAWVRHKGSRTLKECYGLDFLPEDPGGRARLLAFAKGKTQDDAQRNDERIHVALPVVLSHKGRSRRERLADLSTGGAFLRTSSPLPPGTDVEVALRPPGALLRLHLQAKVAWANRAGAAAGMGLQFVYEDERQARKLRQLVERLRADG